MKARINYAGGANQQDRMISDKLRSLKKAMLYSYQAATAILQDGRMFRCLINPDKLKLDYDDKIISIPYEDICIGKIVEQIDEETGEIIKIEQSVPRVGKTSEGLEPIGLKVGDVFTWKETNTDWMVYLQMLEEDAYFRAEIRKCDYEVEINGNPYKVWARGPENDLISWHTKKNISWNDIDHTIVMYITKNEETEKFFHRFVRFDLGGKPWEVQTVDGISSEGILEVTIQEWYDNTIEDLVNEEKKQEESQQPEIDKSLPHILGDTVVYPYDEKQYTIENLSGGIWLVDNPKKAVITSQTERQVDLAIITGKSGEVNLIYRTDKEDITLNIVIESL